MHGRPACLYACRYRVTAYPDWKVERVKQALFGGGIARANKPDGVRNTPGIQVRCPRPPDCAALWVVGRMVADSLW